jgi:hypothetical protein
MEAKKKVLIVAHPYEIGLKRLEENGFQRNAGSDERPTIYVQGNNTVAIVGIGLQEAGASFERMKREELLDDADVLLAGSAGSYTLPVLHTVQCESGYPSLDSPYPKGEIVCVHEFVSPESPHPELHVPDTCFDMESEALFAVCRDANVHSLSIVKVISDDGSGSLGDWATVCQQQVQPLVWEVAEWFFLKNML